MSKVAAVPVKVTATFVFWDETFVSRNDLVAKLRSSGVEVVRSVKATSAGTVRATRFDAEIVVALKDHITSGIAEAVQSAAKAAEKKIFWIGHQTSGPDWQRLADFLRDIPVRAPAPPRITTPVIQLCPDKSCESPDKDYVVLAEAYAKDNDELKKRLAEAEVEAERASAEAKRQRATVEEQAGALKKLQRELEEFRAKVAVLEQDVDGEAGREAVSAASREAVVAKVAGRRAAYHAERTRIADEKAVKRLIETVRSNPGIGISHLRALTKYDQDRITRVTRTAIERKEIVQHKLKDGPRSLVAHYVTSNVPNAVRRELQRRALAEATALPKVDPVKLGILKRATRVDLRERILKLIGESPGIGKSEIFTRAHAGRGAIDKELESLIKSGAVVSERAVLYGRRGVVHFLAGNKAEVPKAEASPPKGGVEEHLEALVKAGVMSLSEAMARAAKK